MTNQEFNDAVARIRKQLPDCNASVHAIRSTDAENEYLVSIRRGSVILGAERGHVLADVVGRVIETARKPTFEKLIDLRSSARQMYAGILEIDKKDIENPYDTPAASEMAIACMVGQIRKKLQENFTAVYEEGVRLRAKIDTSAFPDVQ